MHVSHLTGLRRLEINRSRLTGEAGDDRGRLVSGDRVKLLIGHGGGVSFAVFKLSFEFTGRGKQELVLETLLPE